MTVFDYDSIVVGSGFGGSVAALRLTERGKRIAVLERGRRWTEATYPKTNWNLPKYLWAPQVGCRGIQAITTLSDVMILHGVGVGGGSLVYGCVLIEPPSDVFRDASWSTLGDWQQDLAPHYQTARQMLGVTRAQGLGETDRMLEQIAHDLGQGDSFQPTDVGIYFGEKGSRVADPYLGGRGPDRAGCMLCGGCMVGCRFHAKNSVDKNYLYLAESLGATIVPETEVYRIEEISGGGYRLHTARPGLTLSRQRRRFTCRSVVMAGGVMGTVPLLLKCKRNGDLPRISDQLGDVVRTNSEALVGATSRRKNVDYSNGIAIASGFRPDRDTNIEMVRYGKGQDLLSLIATMLVEPTPPWPRSLQLLAKAARHPQTFLRLLVPFGWARKSGILLVMQSVPNHMRLQLRRRWYPPFSLKIDSYWHSGQEIPKYLPIANEVAKRLADKMDGDASMSLPETLFNLTTTAHILGGCCMGDGPHNGVVDKYGRLFGYDRFYVADGSVLPVNLSVNPSLTIAALSEWIMSHMVDD